MFGPHETSFIRVAHGAPESCAHRVMPTRTSDHETGFPSTKSDDASSTVRVMLTVHAWPLQETVGVAVAPAIFDSCTTTAPSPPSGGSGSVRDTVTTSSSLAHCVLTPLLLVTEHVSPPAKVNADNSLAPCNRIFSPLNVDV